MKQIILILGVLCCSLTSGAQFYSSQRDSIQDVEILDAFYYKTKFIIDLTHERTLLNPGINVKMNVLRIGFQFMKNYKVGMYFAISKTYETYASEINDVALYETNLRGNGVFFEYVIIENYRWYLGASSTFGRGWVIGEAIDMNGIRLEQFDFETDKFGVFSIGVNGGYNVNYWLGMQGGVGYRFTHNASSNNKQQLTTPYYSAGLSMKFGHLLTTVFHHKRVQKMKSIYFKDKDSLFAKRFKNRNPAYFK